MAYYGCDAIRLPGLGIGEIGRCLVHRNVITEARNCIRALVMSYRRSSQSLCPFPDALPSSQSPDGVIGRLWEGRVDLVLHRCIN